MLSCKIICHKITYCKIYLHLKTMLITIALNVLYNKPMDFIIKLTYIFCLSNVESLALFKLFSLSILYRILQGNLYNLRVL